MKRIITIIVLMTLAGMIFAQEATNKAPEIKEVYVEPIRTNPYTQLFGIKGGGAFFLSSSMAGWAGGVFFENVIDNLFGSGIMYGIEIKIMQNEVPITNYDTFTGYGLKRYFELGGGFKLYFGRIALFLGLNYNDFINGYLIYNSYTNYTEIRDSGENYISAYAGLEMSAQITSDLYTKVGAEFVYGILNDAATGVRFYAIFAYGM